jgi:hypothetical protein
MVIVIVRCHLHPRTLLLLILRADLRSTQHTRCGLGNAFGADAHAIARVIARWGKICASSFSLLLAQGFFCAFMGHRWTFCLNAKVQGSLKAIFAGTWIYYIIT